MTEADNTLKIMSKKNAKPTRAFIIHRIASLLTRHKQLEDTYTHTHTHTHIYIYIYINVQGI